jgi:hypothetical protein
MRAFSSCLNLNYAAENFKRKGRRERKGSQSDVRLDFAFSLRSPRPLRLKRTIRLLVSSSHAFDFPDRALST